MNMRITFYLFKKSVVEFRDVWKVGTGGLPAEYTKVRLKSTVPFEGEAYLQANKPAIPEWWTFIEPYCAIRDADKPLNRSSSFVVLLKIKRRIFAATFGHGFAALERGKLEPDFGLKVTLNSVDPSR